MRGKFITFEGGEGAGKSSQIKAAAAHIRACGFEVVETREPGGTVGAEAIRDLVVNGDAGRWEPMCELMLMMAARSDHIDRLIRPSLAKGMWVLSDRFHDSSRVYQGLAGQLGLSLVDHFHQLLLSNDIPDLTIMIDVDPEVGLMRRANDVQSARFEAKGLHYHRLVRDGFLYLCDLEPDRLVKIDGSRQLSEVEREIAVLIGRKFGLASQSDE